jgi:hypothetical protein
VMAFNPSGLYVFVLPPFAISNIGTKVWIDHW